MEQKKIYKPTMRTSTILIALLFILALFGQCSGGKKAFEPADVPLQSSHKTPEDAVFAFFIDVQSKKDFSPTSLEGVLCNESEFINLFAANSEASQVWIEKNGIKRYWSFYSSLREAHLSSLSALLGDGKIEKNGLSLPALDQKSYRNGVEILRLQGPVSVKWDGKTRDIRIIQAIVHKNGTYKVCNLQEQD